MVSLPGHVNPKNKEKHFSILLHYVNKQTLPRMLCNGNGVLPHLQMGVAIMGFVEDFHYGLNNFKNTFSAPFGIFYVKTEI